MKLGKYSIGVGDRFGHQGKAQLEAIIRGAGHGVHVTPVWNKSYREHSIVKTSPDHVRAEADAAARALGWKRPYFVDADHVGLSTVDGFITGSDFFTLDVADFTGQAASDSDIDAFVRQNKLYVGRLHVPGIEEELLLTEEDIRKIAAKYLLAVQEAGRIYRHIESIKGKANFVTEVSMDETDQPQGPIQLFFILAAVADEGIPAQTIAPKFSGRFNKGVDYVGDVAQFSREFEQDLCVIKHAVNNFGLPENLKLSVHSGSDKFSIYSPINKALSNHDAGLHLKTAGTTWLEELIGLASADGEGLEIAKEVYCRAFDRYEELAGPYATVIDIDREKLPAPERVAEWSSEPFVAALRHHPSCSRYDRNLRQLLHIGYKVAAEMGNRYIAALKKFEAEIAPNVTDNIYQRHLVPVFGGLSEKPMPSAEKGSSSERLYASSK